MHRAIARKVASLEEEIRNGYDVMLQPHIARSPPAVTNLLARIQAKNKNATGCKQL